MAARSTKARPARTAPPPAVEPPIALVEPAATATATAIATATAESVPDSISRPPMLCGRLFEWMTACMMVGVAIIVTLSAKSIQFGGFHLMTDIGLTAPVLGIIFFLVGVMRIAALILNGQWHPYGSQMRFIGAVVGMAIWAQMLYALVIWSNKNGYFSIGVAVYLFLAIGEGISCYRAAADGRPKFY